MPRERIQEMPGRMQTAMGDLSINRGKIEDRHLIAWDTIQDCRDEECILTTMCYYKREGKCTLQMNYLRAVQNMVFRNFRDTLTETQLFRIGLHLIPLYKVLIKLKMRELVVDDVLTETTQGSLKAHPVFKEIRDTIKLIEMMWKSLNLVGGTSGGGAGVPDIDDFINGATGAYESMVEGNEGEKEERDTRKTKKKLVKRNG